MGAGAGSVGVRVAIIASKVGVGVALSAVGLGRGTGVGVAPGLVQATAAMDRAKATVTQGLPIACLNVVKPYMSAHLVPKQRASPCLALYQPGTKPHGVASKNLLLDRV